MNEKYGLLCICIYDQTQPNSINNIKHSNSFPGAHPNNITSGRVQAMIKFYGQGPWMGNKSDTLWTFSQNTGRHTDYKLYVLEKPKTDMPY